MSNPLNALSEALASAVEGASAFTLGVEGTRRWASATVWSDDLAVVATHVLGRKDEGHVVLPGGERRKATVIGRDASTDISVLRIEGGGLSVPKWSESEQVRVGEIVLAVGRPHGEPRVTMGVISGLSGPWSTRLGAPVAKYIDTDGELRRGFSGGALITTEGEVLGMNTHALLRGGATVPTATVRRVVDQLVEHGEIRPGYIGAAVQSVPLGDGAREAAGQPSALLVSSVAPGAPGAEAGIVVGDLLLSVDDGPLQSVEDLLATLSGRTGQEVTLRVLRGTAVEAVKVTVGTRPQRPRGGQRHGRGHGRAQGGGRGRG